MAKLECISRLVKAGISEGDALALRRISMTLHAWHEAECGDSNDYCSFAIERDEETNKPYRVVYRHTENKPRRYSIPDRETGALKRLNAIMARYPDMKAYVQTDPRGASLYILTAHTLKFWEGKEIDTFYSQGIAVYK